MVDLNVQNHSNSRPDSIQNCSNYRPDSVQNHSTVRADSVHNHSNAKAVQQSYCFVAYNCFSHYENQVNWPVSSDSTHIL